MGRCLAIRRILAVLAMLGLLVAPVAGFAHSAMDHGPSMAVSADGGPCCPDNPSDDCPKCALTAPCMAQCLQNVADAHTIAPVGESTCAAILARFDEAVAGLAHAPPRRPPRI